VPLGDLVARICKDAEFFYNYEQMILWENYEFHNFTLMKLVSCLVYIIFVSNCTVQVQTIDNIKTGIAFTVVRICREQVMCSAVCSEHFLPQQQRDICVIIHM